jgi:3-deoxy-D-manno-octulosonic-acid transferase
VLLPAFIEARRTNTDLRLIIAPHEPTESHVAPLEAWARQNAISVTRLSRSDPSASVVIVDTVGILAELYSLARVGYVGGGFHAAGLHSVVEPAAFGIPVIVGPRNSQSRDAGLLLSADAAAVANDVRDMTVALTRLTQPGDERAAEMGRNALGVVQQELGAADRSTALVERLLD